ncbi:glycosyl hydrolase family 61-domain-containing protein [Coprinopsis sp. MPI-PUGE-AT-0042]|nr:glycosyl hydrolase family 61-domain-containing protein [Coprinopsis sp. MPI-PUGE-AT-0042]
MHTSTLLTILPIFLASSLVSAHGVLEQVTIAGKTYAGPPRAITGAAAGQTLARQVNDNGPVASVNAPTMACGDPGKPAALDAEAMPGDSVAFKWSASWPHVVGPMMTYMADCGGSCTNFDASQAKWFKIDQKGFKDSGEWYQADIKAGKPDVVTIPQNLKPGHYLMRNELIATHNTPAEFYPSCAQVKVGGSGTGVPSANELVSFPGGYTGQEPGLGSGYSMKPAGYQFPGPPLSTLAGSGGSPNSPILAADPVEDGASSSSAPSPVGVPTSSAAVPAPSEGASVPSEDVPVPSPSSDAPPAAPSAEAPYPSEAPAPPSQPSGGYEYGYESCRSNKHSRSRMFRPEVTPEAPAPASNVRRAVHSRVMRRMAASHSH